MKNKTVKTNISEIDNYVIGEPLDDYIRDKHTQEECTGFIHGYKNRMKEEEVLYTEKEVRDLIWKSKTFYTLYRRMSYDKMETYFNSWFGENKKK